MPSGPERVQEALDSKGLDTKVVRLPDSTRTAPEAAKAVGCDVGAIAKSLLFLADGEPLLVVCAGDRRVTGYAIGGVPPLGHAGEVPIVMDESLLRWPLIYAAAGAPDALFPVEPNLLARVTGARLASVGA